MDVDREAPWTRWADELSEGVLLVVDGKVGWLNLPAAELLGVDGERALGAPLMAVVRDHRLERVALGGPAADVTIGGRTLSARPVPGGLALRDVSEVRRSREEARSLLAVLSHELRTPATTIRAALEALRFDLGEEEKSRFLAHAEAECARLVRLIEDLTVESAPPRERRLELAAVLARAAGILAPLLEERGVRLRLELPNLLVSADEDKLLQVILNLVENAVIHGPRRADVTVSAAEEAADEVAVAVCDRGTPLAPGLFEALFQPHSRGGRGSGKGSGLGLYIVRSIVERWGGRVWGRARGRGNEFGFTVPGAGRR
jgi:signal transduction histidine kinase